MNVFIVTGHNKSTLLCHVLLVKIQSGTDMSPDHPAWQRPSCRALVVRSLVVKSLVVRSLVVRLRPSGSRDK